MKASYPIIVIALLINLSLSAQNIFPSSGSVGIGTTSPQYMLDVVNGSSRFGFGTNSSGLGDILRIYGLNGLNFSMNPYLTTPNSLLTDLGINYTINGSTGQHPYTVIGAKKSPVIRLDAEEGSVNLYGENGTGIDNRVPTMNLGLSVAGNGFVGIGTTDPRGYRLAVKGELKSYNHDNNSGITIGAENSERPRIGFHVSDNNRRFKIEFNDINQSTERLGFFTNNGGDWAETEVFSISKIGNVGIGTLPQGVYRLAVNGDAIFTKIKVKQYGNWPDYVFEKEYKLPTLSEVEVYINQHKHLPDVPSAKEVETNGLDLGNNQALLLKKIEELTLYVINQGKKIEEYNKKQETQQKEIDSLIKENQAIKELLKNSSH